MEFSEYPLLNTPHLALIVMKASAMAGATLDDAVVCLRNALQQARENPPFADTSLRAHLEKIAIRLSQLGLLEPVGGGDLRITRRGRDILAEYPNGFDFADVTDHLHAWRRMPRQRGDMSDPRRREFGEGYDANRQCKSISENPYMQDSVSHVAWEDGWCGARDDAARAYTV